MHPHVYPELVRCGLAGSKHLEAFNGEKIEKYLEKIEEKNKESYHFVLGDPRGRWFIRQLCARAFFDAPTFTGNSNSFYNEGQRRLALDIVNDMKQSGLDLHKLVVQAEIEELNIKEELAQIIKHYKKGEINDE